MGMIVLTVAIATAGSVLVLLLWRALRAAQSEPKVAVHRSGAQALADLLIYAALVSDGLIVGKDGSFSAAWWFCGADDASSTEEERESVSARINQALVGLGSGWMVHVDAVRHAAPSYPDASRSQFPDRVSAAIDAERRRLFEGLGTMYEGYFVLTLTWLPPALLERRFVDLMFDDEDAKAPSRSERTQGLIDQFEREIRSIESRLSLAFTLQRLRARRVQPEDGAPVVHEEFLSFLHRCITGIHQPIVLPRTPMYLDALVGGQELWGGLVPRVGRRYVQVVAIVGFPAECTPGVLNALAELPCEYRWSTRFIFMDPHESAAHLDRYRKKWRQKIRGFFDQVFNTATGPVDHDAVSMVQDAEAGLADVNSGSVAMGYYTSAIILMDEDRETVERSARQVEKAIQGLGFVARIETLNTLDAYLGSLPGHGVENVRRPLLHTMNLADLLPTSSIWTGSETAPCPFYPAGAPALMQCVTHGATPFHFNVHVGGELGHTLMFGPTQAGKSTHLGLMAAQFRRYGGITISAFDKGRSLYAITKAVGGLHFAVGADTGLSFTPLQFLDTPGDRAWAAEWIETLLVLNGVEVSPAQRNQIGRAIESLHASHSRTLSEFSLTVQDAAIREALRPYTVDGLMGHLLDAKEDGLRLSSFNTFELGELLSLGEKFALPVLLYLFRRIERGLHGQPAVILIDEAWVMLAHPAFRAKIREWLKTLRKANCVVILATQSLSDAAHSGILDVLVESTATKIFLPNLFARDEDAAALYRRMGLNAREIETIATAVPKREYYYVSAEGRRLYDLALGPLALAFVGAGDKESLAAIARCEARFESGWVDAWLESQGLRLEESEEVAA